LFQRRVYVGDRRERAARVLLVLSNFAPGRTAVFSLRMNSRLNERIGATWRRRAFRRRFLGDGGHRLDRKLIGSEFRYDRLVPGTMHELLDEDPSEKHQIV
jgi:hypothetical protein